MTPQSRNAVALKAYTMYSIAMPVTNIGLTFSKGGTVAQG